MAVVALVLPFLLLRTLPAETFGVWALVMQIAAYTSVLSFNMQTVVARYVALEVGAGRPEQARRFVSSAFFLLAIGGAVAVVLVLVAFLSFGQVFHNVPPVLANQAAIALLLMGLALSVTLPGAALNGIFAGLQRSHVVAGVTVVSRVLLVILVVAAARATHDLGWMGLAFALTNLITVAVMAWQVSRIDPPLSVRRHLIGRSEVSELVDYSTSLAVWSIAMLLVTGLNSAIVGLFDYPSLPAFAVSATLVAFLVGVQQSIFAVLIPAVAHRLGEADGAAGMDKLLLSTTRYGCFLLALVGFPLLIWAKPILALWTTPEIAETGAPILRILVIGNMVRLSAVPFVNLAIAAGAHRKFLLTPLIEGVVNLTVSVILCQHIGAVGVAWGTLIGAFFGVGGNILVNMSSEGMLYIKIRDYVLKGLVWPYACFLPAILILMFGDEFPLIAKILGLTTSVILMFFFGFDANERQLIRKYLAR